MVKSIPNPANTMVVIPARMASTRLPGKPIADIAGLPMIVQVWQRAMEAQLGRVLVAGAQDEICQAVRDVGGEAVLTDPDLPSGSDRVAAALELADKNNEIEFVINLQGDLPTIDPHAIKTCLAAFLAHECDITTLAAAIDPPDEEDISNPNVVKVVAHFATGETTTIADNFTRLLPPDAMPPFWHHIGLYAYHRAALQRFVSLPVSPREEQHKLEQLRALDNDMKIAVAQVNSVPFGVDTPQDLARARMILSANT